MLTVRPLHRGAVRVTEHLCTADGQTAPVEEQHQDWSISYVRRGSFGCLCRGHQFQLVPGSCMVGRPGDDYLCTHEHHAGGDECLSFYFTPELVDEVQRRSRVWQSGAAPPLAELGVLGELAQAALQQAHDVAIDEVGLTLAGRYVDLMAGTQRGPLRTSAAEQKRAVQSALWIEHSSAEPLTLDAMAAAAGWSPFHYLRVFSAVIGATPHQVLVRSRLRKAARLLANEERAVTDIALDVGFADLSNFVRSFHRAAGVSPRGFRRAARGERKILQERLAARA